jgi:hypothetical protein
MVRPLDKEMQHLGTVRKVLGSLADPRALTAVEPRR